MLSHLLAAARPVIHASTYMGPGSTNTLPDILFRLFPTVDQVHVHACLEVYNQYD